MYFSKLIFAGWLALLSVAALAVDIGGPLIPIYSGPSHSEQYGLGGWHSVADEAARTNLASYLRKSGMAVFQIDSVTAYTLGDDLVTWSPLTSGGSVTDTVARLDILILETGKQDVGISPTFAQSTDTVNTAIAPLATTQTVGALSVRVGLVEGFTNYAYTAWLWGDWATRVGAIEGKTNDWNAAFGWGDWAASFAVLSTGKVDFGTFNASNAVRAAATTNLQDQITVATGRLTRVEAFTNLADTAVQPADDWTSTILGMAGATLTNWTTQGYIFATNWSSHIARTITSGMMSNWDSAYIAGTNWLASISYSITAANTNDWTQAKITADLAAVKTVVNTQVLSYAQYPLALTNVNLTLAQSNAFSFVQTAPGAWTLTMQTNVAGGAADGVGVDSTNTPSGAGKMLYSSGTAKTNAYWGDAPAGGSGWSGWYSVYSTNGNLTITTNDCNKLLIYTGTAGNNTFSLPSVAATDVGCHFQFAKTGAGKLIIDAADSDKIRDSGAGDTIYNDQAGEVYATIHLILIAETQWAIAGFDGTWTTTD